MLPRARIEPLTLDEMDEEQRAAIAPVLLTRSGERRAPLNIFATLVRTPKAFTRFLEWSTYILSKRSSLTLREREIVILRTGFRCRSGYEFTQHVKIGLAVGMTTDEIASIKREDISSWLAVERILLRLADEMTATFSVSNETWNELTSHYDTVKCMDAIYTIGQYTQVAMFLNTFGVQLDPGLQLDPSFGVAP